MHRARRRTPNLRQLKKEMSAETSESDEGPVAMRRAPATLSGSGFSASHVSPVAKRRAPATLSGSEVSADDVSPVAIRRAPATLWGSDISAPDESSSLPTSRMWAPSDFSEESETCDQPDELLSTTRSFESLETNAFAGISLPNPGTKTMSKLHADLCNFHAVHGEEAIPRKRKHATSKEFSLASRLEKLRRR